MTIEEAEEYYKKFLGHAFHMGREDESRYHTFKQLNLPAEYFIRWDYDLLNQQYDKMWTDPERVWVSVMNIIDIVYRGRCSYEVEVSRLLDEMEKMQNLSIGCRRQIISIMAGSTSSQKDGGVWLICTKTKQKDRMKDVMNGLIKDQKGADKYFTSSLQRYEDALRWFGR